MNTKVMNKPMVNAIQLFLLLFTMLFAISSFAAPVTDSKHDNAFKATSAQQIIMAKGQPYVPPKGKSKEC